MFESELPKIAQIFLKNPVRHVQVRKKYSGYKEEWDGIVKKWIKIKFATIVINARSHRRDPDCSI